MQKSYLTWAVATALCSLLVLSSSTNVFAKSSENPTASQAVASTMPVQSGFSLIHTTMITFSLKMEDIIMPQRQVIAPLTILK